MAIAGPSSCCGERAVAAVVAIAVGVFVQTITYTNWRDNIDHIDRSSTDTSLSTHPATMRC